jgi:tyrosyl-tRNA synthetase
MAKDSVQNRLEAGLSFTEFSYQLVQGYDFYWLYQNKNCKLQMGGSDQWGNITTGTELIRRISGGEAFAFTCPLMTKSDGGKFGKTESGAVWLSAERTSPYDFYQFWVRASDHEASKYIRTFTFLSKEEIETIEIEHHKAPEGRALQKKLADEVTTMVHGAAALEIVHAASKILYGKSTAEDIMKLSEAQFLEIFKGVEQARVSRGDVSKGLGIIDALAGKTGFLPSNSEARRELKANAIAVNKNKVGEDYMITEKDLISNKLVLLSKGKKNNYLLIVE